MDKKLILSKIKELLSSTVKLKDFQVGEMILQVDGDDLDVDKVVRIKTEDGYIDAGNTLDGVHIVESEGKQITIENGIITIVEDIEQEEPTEELQMQSYTDYPNSVKEAAQRVLDYTAENGWGDCGTDVGKQRANQLAKGEPISLDTIKRMYSYLSRHEVDLETSTDYETGCGKLMYDAWGGSTALTWAKQKLESEGELEMEEENNTVLESDKKEENNTILKMQELEERLKAFEEKENNTVLKMQELEEKITALEEKLNNLSTELTDSKDTVSKFSKLLLEKPASVLEDFKSETSGLKSNSPLSMIRNIRSKK